MRKLDGVQVYLMDKRFVDPRRPKGVPTADETAEMLPPYAEELPFDPPLFASHKEIMEGLRGDPPPPLSKSNSHHSLVYLPPGKSSSTFLDPKASQSVKWPQSPDSEASKSRSNNADMTDRWYWWWCWRT
jgi:hypothetical protein